MVTNDDEDNTDDNAMMVIMTMIITITRIRKMETIRRLKTDIFWSRATHLSFWGKKDF